MKNPFSFYYVFSFFRSTLLSFINGKKVDGSSWFTLPASSYVAIEADYLNLMPESWYSVKNVQLYWLIRGSLSGLP